MPKTLVIVESPTKAKTITKFLGKDFVIESSFGHVRDLPKSKMGVDIEGGTFLPTYVTSRDKTKQVKKLKELAEKSGDVIFATDEDREGEAISWHLAEVLHIDPKKAKRIVFHEITKHAIEEALAHPRGIDQKLVDAQQARRILDRLVGYELSPLLWKKVARGLSAGRVQSVAVRLIVEREREIQAFKPDEYWTIEGMFLPQKNTASAGVMAKLHAIDGSAIKKLDLKSKEQVDAILADLQDAAYLIQEIQEKETKRTPPPPFTTSTFQQAANTKFGYSAKQVMRLAQQLYEGVELGTEGSTGLITYMRTDSVNLSKKFITEAGEFIEKNYGKDYALDMPRFYKTKSKGAQEAHEAIRPTDPARTPESIKSFLDPQQYKIYSLVWKRAVATQMAVARLNKTTIDIENQSPITNHKSPIYTFRAAGQTCVFDGWLRLYPNALKEEMLPLLLKGEPMACDKLAADQHFTEPPPRYSDATLVKALEEHGIGRPSTYAPTIGTIEARNYVERDDNKRLKPTDIGAVVNDLLVEHFKEIVDYAFTAQMEENLDAIAEGTKDWQPIVATFYHPFHEHLEKKQEEISKESAVGMRELGTDPKTGKPVSARVGRFGPFVQLGSKDDEEKPRFASLPKGKSTETITLAEALVLLSLPRIVGKTETDEDIIVNTGRFGPYVQVGKTYYSIKVRDPYTITLEEARQVIREKEEAAAKALIKEFTEQGIMVKIGRYGPYVTDGKKNAKIPKDTDPSSLDLAACLELIAKAPEKRGFRRRKKSE